MTPAQRESISKCPHCDDPAPGFAIGVIIGMVLAMALVIAGKVVF